MTRPLRIELAGGLYHVTSRGNRRDAIYLDDSDRSAWLILLALVCKRFNWVCHGWCQMTNHYHVIVETVQGNLAQGMRHLNGVYTQAFNRRHQRVGHVFQGRYKAILVEKDSYLLELARYVVLNPVRARMVNDAADWPWSSYSAMTGLQDEDAPSFVQTDWILGQFGDERQQAVHRYIDFVRAGTGLPCLWKDLRGQMFLGSKSFLEQMQRLSENTLLTEIPRTQRRPLSKPLRDYCDQYEDPKAAMIKAYATGDFTMQQIADFFGVHYATVSRAINKARF